MVDARRPARRKRTRSRGRDEYDRHDESERQRIERLYFEQKRRHRPRHDPRRDEAGGGTEDDRSEASADDEHHHRARARPQGHADTNLANPPRRRVPDDSENTDAREHEGNQRRDGQEDEQVAFPPHRRRELGLERGHVEQRVAVRQALDYKTTGRAVVVCILGAIAYAAVVMMLGVLGLAGIGMGSMM